MITSASYKAIVKPKVVGHLGSFQTARKSVHEFDLRYKISCQYSDSNFQYIFVFALFHLCVYFVCLGLRVGAVIVVGGDFALCNCNLI